MPIRRAKSNLACDLPSRSKQLVLLSTLAAGVCLSGSQAAAVPTVKGCPSPEETGTMLGQASGLMERSQYQQAADSLRPLAGLHCDARVSLLLAAALEQGGNLPEAEKTLEQARAVWPLDNSIAASLARQYLGNGEVEQAAQALQHFHATPRTPIQEMQVAAVALIKAHQLAPAQTVAEMAYKTYPSVQSLLLLANALQLQGRFKEVVSLLNARRNLYSESPAFLVTLAESEYDSILYDAAHDDLKRAIALDQNSYQAHFLLGNALFKLGKADEAITEYRVAIGLSPEQPRTHYQLALTLQSQHDQAGAEQEIAKALSIDRHYAPALIEMGRMLINENKPSDAVTELNLAIHDNPNAEQGYFLLAKAYAQLGDKEKSDEMAKRMVMVRNANWKSSGNQDKR
jgi:tetratricopeptide (TPR) repeat protein